MTLSRLQLAILRILWAHGEATVAAVRDALEDDKRALAYSTVATLLSRLEQKGAVAHRSEGRTFYYRPEVREEEISNTMVSDLVQRVFDGSAADLVSHLLETQDVDSSELARIREMIAQHEGAAARDRKH